MKREITEKTLVSWLNLAGDSDFKPCECPEYKQIFKTIPLLIDYLIAQDGEGIVIPSNI